MSISFNNYDPSNFIDPKDASRYTKASEVDPLKKLIGSIEGEQGLKNNKVDFDARVAGGPGRLQNRLDSVSKLETKKLDFSKLDFIESNIRVFRELTDSTDPKTIKQALINFSRTDPRCQGNTKILINDILDNIIKPLVELPGHITQLQTQIDKPNIPPADKEVFFLRKNQSEEKQKELLEKFDQYLSAPKKFAQTVSTDMLRTIDEDIKVIQEEIEDSAGEIEAFKQQLEIIDQKISRIESFKDKTKHDFTSISFDNMQANDVKAIINAIDSRIQNDTGLTGNQKGMLVSLKETLDFQLTTGKGNITATVLVENNELDILKTIPQLESGVLAYVNEQNAQAVSLFNAIQSNLMVEVDSLRRKGHNKTADLIQNTANDFANTNVGPSSTLNSSEKIYTHIGEKLAGLSSEIESHHEVSHGFKNFLRNTMNIIKARLGMKQAQAPGIENVKPENLVKNDNTAISFAFNRFKDAQKQTQLQTAAQQISKSSVSSSIVESSITSEVTESKKSSRPGKS